MHLPPLNVALYSIVTMSRGTYSRQTIRPSSTASSSSSSSSAIQKVIQNVFRCSRILIQHAERLQGQLHQVYLTKLADGSCLVLKCPPAHNVRVLRHEKNSLETERMVLATLQEYTQLPVPQVINYDSLGRTLGSPYLMISYIPGRQLSEISTKLTTGERENIDRTLGSYLKVLSTLSATQFGMTHLVFAKKGYNTWREAFMALLESILRDAEDMLVTIPYDSIRYYISKNSYFLDEVTKPRLVVVNACEQHNVLVNETTKEVSGIVGFSNVVWGDALMSGGVADGSDAFLEGYGECPVRTGGVMARLLMYKAYRATVRIVAHHYRSHQGTDELDARRSLSFALNDLARL
ncbi:hypothetical protein GQ44DRAFT_750162 [Phaeosphaeriaceae sp. PMI808]|nr:hypothetical protein GQ44DRAFT_750162 [Phaeosphaeriaceae sp. PMI808]